VNHPAPRRVTACGSGGRESKHRLPHADLEECNHEHLGCLFDAWGSVARWREGRGVGEVHDSVTFSVDAVRAAEGTADIRFDKVNAIRAAIADGSYETPEKLDLALERLLDRLG
jgi:hypothetical protein